MRFRYALIYRRGDPEKEPTSAAEAPTNLLAMTSDREPTRSVVWHHRSRTWRRDTAVYEGMWTHPERYRARTVDRATAEREVLRFATTPLPSEAELMAIVRTGLPG